MRIGILLFVLLSFWGRDLCAQSNYPDLVRLKNGSILKCKILEYQLEGHIKVEIMGGSVLVYPSTDLESIERGGANLTALPDSMQKARHIYETGMYYYLNLDFLGGIQESTWGGTTPTLGLGSKLGLGWVKHRHLMLGGGVGWVFMDNVFMFSHHIPVYAELRGDLLKRDWSLYYSVSMGYNFALRQNRVDWTGLQMTAARGGIYVNPSLGLRFASRSKAHLCIEFGYSIHSASFDYLGRDGSTATTQNLFVRPKLGCSLMF